MTTAVPAPLDRIPNPGPAAPVAVVGGRGPVRAMVGLELFVIVGAVYGSVAMIAGAYDDVPFVADLPFGSALLGGVALAVVNVLAPVLVVLATWRHRPWATWAHVAYGAALMGWIVVQVAFIGFAFFLQPLMFAIGASLVGLGLVQRRREVRAARSVSR